MDGCCGTGEGRGYTVSCCGPSRGFLTTKEKIEMLEEYRQTLEKEAQGVSERIKELKKQN